MSPRPRSFYIQKELYTGRAAPEGDPARREGGLGSDATEHGSVSLSVSEASSLKPVDLR